MKIADFKIVSIKPMQKNEVIDYGVMMSGAPLEWGETTGEGIKVGIIDTGIDLKHEDLREGIADAVSFVPQNGSPADDNGHGTHVAGIIGARRNNIGVVGVAPSCEIYSAKAFDKNGNSEFDAIYKSINWLIKKGVNIINMSFSANDANKGYEGILQKANDSGITLVCAAGNDGKGGDNTIGYPAKFAQTITVTAVDINKRLTEFSSQGYETELCAAGKDIYSTYINNSYASLSGTSMATPIITGAAAILHGKGRRRYRRLLSHQEIRFLLHMYTEGLGDKGWNKYYGYGLFSFGRLNKSEMIY